jgi:NTP pyrophosphatase (non-canonical NTP hydrolase)
MKLDRKDRHYFMKCIEELNELSLELIHAVNKPNKENLGKICDEIKDVEKYIVYVKGVCNEKS